MLDNDGKMFETPKLFRPRSFAGNWMVGLSVKLGGAGINAMSVSNTASVECRDVSYSGVGFVRSLTVISVISGYAMTS